MKETVRIRHASTADLEKLKQKLNNKMYTYEVVARDALEVTMRLWRHFEDEGLAQEIIKEAVNVIVITRAVE